MEYETCWLNIICLAGIFEGVRQVHQQKISLAPGERVRAKLVTQKFFSSVIVAQILRTKAWYLFYKQVVNCFFYCT